MLIVLAHGVSVECGVSSGEVVFELAFDIGEEGGCSDSEKVGGEPIVSEFIFHEHEVFGCLFGGADSTSWFKTDFDSCTFLVVANESGHDEGEGEGGIDGFFAS